MIATAIRIFSLILLPLLPTGTWCYKKWVDDPGLRPPDILFKDAWTRGVFLKKRSACISSLCYVLPVLRYA